MQRKLEKVDCSRGAPMGRPSHITRPDRAFRMYMVKLPLGDGGAYDSGGAYWGCGDPLYWAYGDGNDQEMFVRAKTREDAKRQVLKEFPNIYFTR